MLTLHIFNIFESKKMIVLHVNVDVLNDFLVRYLNYI